MINTVIVDIVRTASGKGTPGGALSGIHPVDLLARTLRALVERNDLDPAMIEDVIAGCVTQAADQAANVARNALLAAGFPVEVPGTTIDRQCGSSQQAVHFAAHGVAAGAYDIVIAGGVESMSRVPMLSSVRGGSPQDPLLVRFPSLPNQGIGAELIAARWNLSREDLDAFSLASHSKAAAASAAGDFTNEVIPIELIEGRHTVDETVRAGTTLDSLGALQPSFYEENAAALYPEITWAVTAGNSSPFTDGASAALIMSEARALELGMTPRARFHSFTVVGSDPELMLTGPIPATHKALRGSGLRIDDIDVYEVNEAFASVPLAWAAEFDADPSRLNPRGGAIALGHALGSSGTRILGTMVNYLEDTSGRFGLQTMCEGGGMANVTIIERLG